MGTARTVRHRTSRQWARRRCREDLAVDAGKRSFRRCFHQGETAEREAIVDRTSALSVSQHARDVGVVKS